MSSNEIKDILRSFIRNKDLTSLQSLIDSIPPELEIPQVFSKGTSLIFYANHPDQKIFTYLLNNPRINKTLIDKTNGTTALYQNLKNISVENFERYLKILPHDNIIFKFGNEPDLLFACAARLRWDLVSILILNKFPIRDNAFHDNILTICSRNNKTELVELILEQKQYKFINVNFKNKLAVNYRPFNQKISDCFSNASTVSEFNKILFNNTFPKKSKLLADYVFNFSNNQINYVNLSMLDLCFFMGLDLNYAESFIKTNFNNPINFCISDFEKKILKQTFEVLAKIYPQERIQILFRSIPSCFVTDLAIEIQDILDMLKKAQSYSLEFPKKPKSFIDLRLMLSRLMRKIDQQNFELIPQLGIKVLEKIKLEKEELELFVPVNNFDLIDASHFINICVGSGEYARKIMDEESLILLLKSNSKLKYCVEISYDNFFQIIQAKGEGNSPMSSELVVELQDKIKEIMNHYSD